MGNIAQILDQFKCVRNIFKLRIVWKLFQKNSKSSISINSNFPANIKDIKKVSQQSYLLRQDTLKNDDNIKFQISIRI